MTSGNQNPELLACPFCGGKASILFDSGGRGAFVRCGDCGATTRHYLSAAPSLPAKSAWNTRAHTALLKECLEVVEALTSAVVYAMDALNLDDPPESVDRARALAAKIREAIDVPAK